MKASLDVKAADLQRLGVSKPYSHQLLAGGKMPSLSLALRLQKELGIPVEVWPLPQKRAANDDQRPAEAA